MSGLIEAIEAQDAQKVKEFLENGSSPNDGFLNADNSPLICAADCGNIEVVELLLAYGADVNYQSDAGDSPLICAAVIGSERIVSVLLDRGAEVNSRNRFGATAPGYAKHHEHLSVVKLLLDKGAVDEAQA